MALSIVKGFSPSNPSPINALPTKGPDDYTAYIQEASAETGIPAQIIHNLILAESSGDPNKDSPLGMERGEGLMGVSAQAAQDVGMGGANLRDPQTNIIAGSKYLKRLKDEFGDLDVALSAYNAGPEKVKDAGGGVLAYTAPYIQKVTGKMPKTTSAPTDTLDSQIGKSISEDQGYESQIKAAMPGYEQALEERKKHLETLIDQAEQDRSAYAKLAARRPDAPEETKLPTYAPPPMKNPFQSLLQIMPLLLFTTGKMGRNKGLAMMKSAASAINGLHEGDQEAFKRYNDEFKTNLDATIDQAKLAHDRYMDLLDSNDRSLNDILHEMHMLGVENDLDQLRMGAQTANIDPLIKMEAMSRTSVSTLLQLRNSMTNDEIRREEMRLRELQVEEGANKWQVLRDPSNNTDYRYNPQTGEATTLDGQPYTPKGAQKMAGGNPRSAAAMATQKFMEEHPEATAEDIARFGAEYSQHQRAAVAFTSGRQGDQVRTFNVGISHLDTLDELVQALGNGDTRAINAMGQKFQEEFGAPAPTNFDAAKRIVTDEIVKAIIGGGGGVSDREKAEATLSRANSPQQLEGVIKTYKALMAGQLGGLKKQYQNATGLDDFDDKLLDPTKRELEAAHPSAPKALPDDLPPAKGLKDGTKARDDQGNVVAVVKGGQWTLPG